MKNKFLIFITVFILIFSPTIKAFADEIEYAKGIVTEIISEEENLELKQLLGKDQTTQTVRIKILSGQFKGKEITIENQLTSNPAYDIDLEKNDKILLEVEKENNIYIPYITDKERLPVLYVITGLFFTLLLCVGGKKGFNALLSILITAILIFSVLIPWIMKGYPVVPITVVIAIVSTLATMFIVGGFNLKSTGASLGTALSLLVSGLLSMFVIEFASLKGVYGQEGLILWTSNPNLDFKGILTSAMIIAALGAVMDVGMSIASCINEIKQTDPSLNTKSLIKSGMNVGKDIIGTMSNTLILAYIGSSMFLFLLLENVPMIKFLNLNSVVSEISAALIGSIGIILCVPITAVITSWLVCYKKTN